VKHSVELGKDSANFTLGVDFFEGEPTVVSVDGSTNGQLRVSKEYSTCYHTSCPRVDYYPPHVANPVEIMETPKLRQEYISLD